MTLEAAAFLSAASFFPLPSTAEDVSGRKMVWAHYVPWLTPDNASLMPGRFYNFPQAEVGADPFRAEIERALAQGIDGFFNDMVAHKGGTTSYWDLRPQLKAAEGTPFQVGICLDVKIPAEEQTKELIHMLSTYGNHPNYPKWKNRFVVDTYTFFAWSPEEWRAIRKGCADAGFPLYVIANVESGFGAYSDEKIEAYAGLFERAYFFGINGAAWTGWRSLEEENAMASKCCMRLGARFMPCLWPGYYGAWLDGRNCFYQPFLGFDTLWRHYDWAQRQNADWLHVTTWNDHDETALQQRRLTSGNRNLVKAMAEGFKDLPPRETADVQFAYLRETMVGTLLRIETMRLPAADRSRIEVRGRLVDEKGRPAFELQPRELKGDWARQEWLVPTTSLAYSSVLVPELEVRSRADVQSVVLPPVFLVTACLKNPETVKVSVHDRHAVRSGFGLSWEKGILSGFCAVDGLGRRLKRAILYCNDRPVTSFTSSTNTVLLASVSGTGRNELSIHGGRIVTAVKSFARNGSRDFSWNESRLVSSRTQDWMRHAVRIEANESTELLFQNGQESCRFTPRELVRGAIEVGRGRVSLAQDETLYDSPCIDVSCGKLHLAAWWPKPDPKDAFWVEFELSDGTFAESQVKHPFAADGAPVEMNVIETPVTLERTSGASGLPDSKEFLSSYSDWPVKSNAVVRTTVSPFAIRHEKFELDDPCFHKIPPRRWPMGCFRLAGKLTPLAHDGREHQIVAKDGWNEGPDLKLLADGRLAVALSGGGRRGCEEFLYSVASRQPLERGRSTVFTVVNDGVTLRLLIDGIEQGICRIPVNRCYGNVSPKIGAGVNGECPTVGRLDELEFSGDPNCTLDIEKADSHVREVGAGVCKPGCRHAAELRRHTGIPSLAVSSRSGRLWATYYGGITPGEDSNTYVVLTTSNDDGKTWKTVAIAEPAAGRRVFDPELWIAPDGRLRWTLTTRACKLTLPEDLKLYGGDQGNSLTDSLLMAELSAENEPDGLPVLRPIAEGVMMCKPIVDRAGRWIFPVSHWSQEPSACFYASSDGGRSFSLLGGVSHFPKENRLYDEHSIVERKDGSFLTFIRGKEAPSYLESVSFDGGKTWDKGKRCRFENPSSRLYVRRLKSGNLLLVKNGPLDKNVGRKRLTAYLSDDDGLTWKGGLLLDRRSCSYPDGDQLPDGRIFVVYDHDRMGAQEILYASFREDEVLAGKLFHPQSVLQGVVTSLADQVGREVSSRHRVFSDDMIARTAGNVHRSKEGEISTDGDCEVVTRSVALVGRRLCVHTDCPKGSVKVELLGESSEPLQGFALTNCCAATGVADADVELSFSGGALSSLKRHALQIRFVLDRAIVRSFWVEP